MKVFLSHSSADKALARRLALDLQGARLRVWLGQWELPVGQVFAQRIERGLDEVGSWPEGMSRPPLAAPVPIRACLRRMVATAMPWVHVLSYHELRPDTEIQPVGRIGLDATEQRRDGSVGDTAASARPPGG